MSDSVAALYQHSLDDATVCC